MRWEVREELMAEDALRRREDYLRLTIDTIQEAVGDAALASTSMPAIPVRWF